MINHPRVALGCILFFLSGSFAAASSIVEYEVNDRGNKDSQTAFIADGKVAMTVSDGQQSADVIYDRHSDQFIVVQHNDRSYLVLNEAKVDELTSQASGMRDMIMNNLPEDQQEQAAAILENMGLGGLAKKAAPPAEPQYIQTTETRSIAGFPCKVLKVMKNQKADTEMCVATRETLNISADDYYTLRAMHAFSQRMANKASAILGNLGASFPDLAVGKIDGLPISVKDIDDNVTVTLLQIGEAEVDTTKLRIPEGYQETEIPTIVQ